MAIGEPGREFDVDIVRPSPTARVHTYTLNSAGTSLALDQTLEPIRERDATNFNMDYSLFGKAIAVSIEGTRISVGMPGWGFQVTPNPQDRDGMVFTFKKDPNIDDDWIGVYADILKDIQLTAVQDGKNRYGDINAVANTVFASLIVGGAPSYPDDTGVGAVQLTAWPTDPSFSVNDNKRNTGLNYYLNNDDDDSTPSGHLFLPRGAQTTQPLNREGIADIVYISNSQQSHIGGLMVSSNGGTVNVAPHLFERIDAGTYTDIYDGSIRGLKRLEISLWGGGGGGGGGNGFGGGGGGGSGAAIHQLVIEKKSPFNLVSVSATVGAGGAGGDAGVSGGNGGNSSLTATFNDGLVTHTLNLTAFGGGGGLQRGEGGLGGGLGGGGGGSGGGGNGENPGAAGNNGGIGGATGAGGGGGINARLVGIWFGGASGGQSANGGNAVMFGTVGGTGVGGGGGGGGAGYGDNGANAGLLAVSGSGAGGGGGNGNQGGAPGGSGGVRIRLY